MSSSHTPPVRGGFENYFGAGFKEDLFPHQHINILVLIVCMAKLHFNKGVTIILQKWSM